jgi:hypothetical protein
MVVRPSTSLMSSTLMTGGVRVVDHGLRRGGRRRREVERVRHAHLQHRPLARAEVVAQRRVHRRIRHRHALLQDARPLVHGQRAHARRRRPRRQLADVPEQPAQRRAPVLARVEPQHDADVARPLRERARVGADQLRRAVVVQRDGGGAVQRAPRAAPQARPRAVQEVHEREAEDEEDLLERGADGLAAAGRAAGSGGAGLRGWLRRGGTDPAAGRVVESDGGGGGGVDGRAPPRG